MLNSSASMMKLTINDDNSILTNGRILEYNEPPHNTLSTAGPISTSGNVTTNPSVINPVGFSNINRPISVGGVQTGNKDRLVGYFSSENIFNLSHKVSCETEIRILGKGLQFVPTPSKIDEVLMSSAVECVINGIFEKI